MGQYTFALLFIAVILTPVVVPLAMKYMNPARVHKSGERKELAVTSLKEYVAVIPALNPYHLNECPLGPGALFNKNHYKSSSLIPTEPSNIKLETKPDGTIVLTFQEMFAEAKRNSWEPTKYVVGQNYYGIFTGGEIPFILIEANKVLKIRDLDTESINFNDNFRVYAEDDNVARNILQPRFMEYIEEMARNGLDGLVFNRGWVFAYGDAATPTSGMGENIVSQLPTILPGLYGIGVTSGVSPIEAAERIMPEFPSRAYGDLKNQLG